MAQRNIGTNWNRDNRNNMNDNFTDLYAKYREYFTEITEDLRADLIEGAHIEIKGYYETAAELPTNAESGDTYFVIETGEWERYDDDVWDVVAKTDTSEFVALRDDFTSLEDKYDTFIRMVGSSITSFKQEVNNTIDDKIGDIEEGVQNFIDTLEGQVVYVVEEGSNANGSFVKRSDGTMKCWGKREFSGSYQLEKSPVGSIFRTDGVEWEYPAPFTDDSVSVTTDVSSSSSWCSLSSNPSETGFFFRVFSTNLETYNLVVTMQAMGRWK